MARINDGGPAFPVSTQAKVDPDDRNYGHQDGPVTWQFPGMTLRDYFAARFMERAQSLSETGDGGWNIDTAAQGAYRMADAMLEARAEPQPEPVPPPITYDAWTTPADEHAAIKRLADSQFFHDLPANVVDFVNVALEAIRQSDDGIPF